MGFASQHAASGDFLPSPACALGLRSANPRSHHLGPLPAPQAYLSGSPRLPASSTKIRSASNRRVTLRTGVSERRHDRL
eukprot:10371052-Alexandrium_andersonii.AAC.1